MSTIYPYTCFFFIRYHVFVDGDSLVLSLTERNSGFSLATVWRVIFVGTNFHGKSEKAFKINFRGFKFRDSNQSRDVALLH